MSFESMAKKFHRKQISPRLHADIQGSLSSPGGTDEKVTDTGVKSPAARGHEGGLIGGPRRDEVLTSSEKENIARKGGYARWGEAKREEKR